MTTLNNRFNEQKGNMSRGRIKKNIINFFQSDTPIVSDRVRVILSNQEDSEKLAKAVQDKRRDPEKTISFKLSADTNQKIKELEY